MVIGRWLVGWCFPKRDLLILDDPIPDKLYCQRKSTCCEDGKDSEKDPEKGIDELDGRVESVDTDINITREVDRCDLWHMVHKLDKEPNNHIRVANSLATQNGGVHNVQVELEMQDESATPTLSSYKSTEI